MTIWPLLVVLFPVVVIAGVVWMTAAVLLLLVVWLTWCVPVAGMRSSSTRRKYATTSDGAPAVAPLRFAPRKNGSSSAGDGPAAARAVPNAGARVALTRDR